MKKKFINLLLVIGILIIFSIPIFALDTIDVKDYIKDKFPSIFSFYLSSLEDLDQYEKEFIDLLQNLPEDKQEYYAKEVYKNGFSLELLKCLKEGKTIKVPVGTTILPSLPKQKEESTENLPSIIKRIEPSTVIIFAYNDKGEFLKLGSGFFISQNGDVITNYHVIQGANSAELKTSDGKTYPITYIVADDEQSDIVRLSVDIPSKYVRPLSLTETIPEVGERIIVYGSPLGLEKTVSDGIVSAIREVPGYGKLIQITAPISPGSSGSPVLNVNGEVIGIATFQMIEGQNLNFAIPSEKIVKLNLKEKKLISIFETKEYQEYKEEKKYDYFYDAYAKGIYFVYIEEYEKALPYLEIAIKIDQRDAFVYWAIGICYKELGSYKEAIEAYKQSVRIDPDYSTAHYSLGCLYDEIGLYKEAIEAYKQAIRIDPDYVDAHCNLGVTYGKLGDYTKSIEASKQVIRIDPDYFNAYCNLGNAYGNLGYYTKAIEAYKQAIRIDPDNARVHYSLGGTYFIIGDKNSALNEYKILKELDIDLANKLFDLIY